MRVALLPDAKETGFASYSPDGRRIVSISNTGTVRVARADGSGEPTLLARHGGQGFVAVFSPRGDRVLSAGADKTAGVWDAAGVRAPLILHHPTAVFLGAWSPDGRRVVTGASDRIVRVWGLDRASEPDYEPLLLPHEDMLSMVAFTDGGARVLTVSQGVARSWPTTLAGFAQGLRELNEDCLPPPLRRKYLEEAEDTARHGYETCEREAGRPPALLRLP
jgi:WD40 repeat protein